MTTTPYFTRWIKRSIAIGNSLKSYKTLQKQEIEQLVGEFLEICDHEGVIVSFFERNYHMDLLEMLDTFDSGIQRTIVKIFNKFIRSDKDIKMKLQTSQNFISMLIKNSCQLLAKINSQKLLETLLIFLMEFFQDCQTDHNLEHKLSEEEYHLFIETLTTIGLVNCSQNTISALVNLMNSSLNSLKSITHIKTGHHSDIQRNNKVYLNNIFEKFLATNMKTLLLKWKSAGSSNQKLGIILCKFLYNSFDISDSDQVLCIALESNLDDLLMKVLFEMHLTLNSDYYLSALKLFYKLLIHNSHRSQNTQSLFEEYVKTIINKYQPILALSLSETIRRYNILDITIYGFKLFHLTLSVIDNLSQVLNESDQFSWLGLIQDIVINNLENAEILECSFKIILEMLSLNQQLILSIGYLNGMNEFTIDSILIQIFYTQVYMTTGLFCAACKLMSFLNSNSEKLQNKFLEANMHMMIHLITMNLTSKLPINSTKDFEIRCCSVNAQRSLILFNFPAKELYFNEEVQYQASKNFLINLQNSHFSINHNQQFSDFLTSNILFLASLVEYNPFKYDLLLGKEFHLYELLNCIKCSKNFEIIESLQELFIVLCGSEAESEILNGIWPIYSWLETCSKLINSYVVQKNTIIYLQLNISVIDVKIYVNILEDIGEMLFRATAMFGDSHILRAEAIVLIQILIKQIPEFTNVCTNDKINLDLLIFETICYSQDQELIDIALQAFYVLTVSNSIREKMIKKAVTIANIDFLQCMLALGTDISQISKELLLIAVKHTNENQISYKLTSLLLKHGCSPDKYVILACVQYNNRLTLTLLLSCFNVYQSDMGHILKWDNLNLQQLETNWFIQLFSGINQGNIDKHIENLASKVLQESKNRMKLKKLNQKNLLSQNIHTRFPTSQNRTLDNDIGGIVYHTKKAIAAESYSSVPEYNPDTVAVVPRSGSRIDNQISENTTIRRSSSIHFSKSFNLLDDSISVRSLGNPIEKTIDKSQVIRQSISFRPRPKLDIEWKADKAYRSEENLWIKNNLRKLEKQDFSYKPLSGEYQEFYTSFRSGSDFPHNPMDPRCILQRIRKKSSVSKFETTFYFSSRQYLKTYQKWRMSDTTIQRSNDLNECIDEDDSGSNSTRTISKLSDIDLSDNKLESLVGLESITDHSVLFSMFGSMSTLKVNVNLLTFLPDIHLFSAMPYLTTLELHSNHLTEIPWLIFTYCRLKDLNISQNKIQSLTMPDAVKDQFTNNNNVKHLETLFIGENELVDIDYSCLSIFLNLSKLNLQSCALKFQVDSRLNLPNLLNLNLRDNSIDRLNESFIENCKSISQINLSQNKMVPDLEGLSVRLWLFDNLTDLDLSHNNLACSKPFYIPKDILKIPNLKYLNMSYNNIVEFPPTTVWTSNKLEQLIFSHNMISEMQLLNAKQKFSCLRYLDISYNLLKQLPAEIGQLSQLNYLNISHNKQLTTLPDEIGLLKSKSLNTLIIEGLSLDIPKHLQKDTARLMDILKYYYNRLRNSIEYYTLKMMVLGYGGRGKTSLLASLQNQKPKLYIKSTTIGIDLSTWRYSTRHNDKTVEYKFSCWDLAGQEDFYSTHECFLSQRALYLLVFNASKTESELTNLSPWLLNIKSQAPFAPVIVIGTHLDKIREENQEIQKKFLKTCLQKKFHSSEYPRILDFMVVDSRSNNKSIELLRQRIVSILEHYTIKGEPLMGEKHPACYLKLEEILLEQSHKLPQDYPILTEKEIKELVMSHKLSIDEDEFEQAIEFLNDCGIIIHFKDLMLRINKLYFLNPQWLCSMMAKIVTLKALNPFIHNGVMKLADFLILFMKQNMEVPLPKDVNIEMHAMRCLRILEKFDVAFQRTNKEIIIPSKLIDTKPVISSLNLMKDRRLSRIFEFAFLPTGFWSRLISRICVLEQSIKHEIDGLNIEQLHLWRHGVIMIWNPTLQMCLEGRREAKEIIELNVSVSELGVRIFVQIIDCIEVFVDEWYPGLTESDTRGFTPMHQYPICPNCQSNFSMSEVVKRAMETRTSCNSEKYIICSTCTQIQAINNVIEICKIPLRIIAPDVVLGDLPDEFTVNPNLLEIKLNQDMIVGNGANGVVYEGKYNNQPCAVKYQQQSGDFLSCAGPPSYRILRQEISILMTNRHRSLISMIAADMEKIVLEFAKWKDLTSVIKQHNLPRRLIQRIIFQAIEGLQFLHSKNIIYRDFKPQNVLMFSLNLNAPINAKLSDYGISRVLAPFGLMNNIGTPGFQAPEVIGRSMVYDLSADIFSVGISLFVVATRNHHPEELRPHWRPGTSIELISKFGCDNWPRMQELINHCLKLVPDDRPTAKEVVEYLKCPSFITIKSIWLLTRQTRVECCQTLVTKDNKVKIFIANGNQFKQEVRCLDIFAGTSKGKPFFKSSKLTRVLSMMLMDDCALLGTQSGQIWLYMYQVDEFNKTMMSFPDTVLSMALMQPFEDVKVLIFGLANGSIYYRVDALSLMEMHFEDFNVIHLSDSPISNIYVAGSKCFVTCGSAVFKISFCYHKDILEASKIIEIGCEDDQRLIKCFCVVTDPLNESDKELDQTDEDYQQLNRPPNPVSFYFSLRNEYLVYHHDEFGNQLSPAINVSNLIKYKLHNSDDRSNYNSSNNDNDNTSGDSSSNHRIMSLAVWGEQRYIAIGTGSGHLVVRDQRLNHTTLLRLYRQPVICIQHTKIKPTGIPETSMKMFTSITNTEYFSKEEKERDSFVKSSQDKAWLIVIGNGYKTIGEEEYDGAVLLLIRDDISKISRQLDEHITSRRTL